MFFFSHLHRLLCRHCRRTKPLPCRSKDKDNKKSRGRKVKVDSSPEKPGRPDRSQSVPRDARATRVTLSRAYADLQRELAKQQQQHERDVAAGVAAKIDDGRFDGRVDGRHGKIGGKIDSRLDDRLDAGKVDDDNLLDKPQLTPLSPRPPNRIVPLSFLADLSASSTAAHNGRPDVVQSPSLPPVPVPTATTTPLRRLPRKRVGSAPTNTIDNVNANIDDANIDASASASASVATATVQQLTPARPTLVSIVRMRRAPSCLAIGRSYRAGGGNTVAGRDRDDYRLSEESPPPALAIHPPTAPLPPLPPLSPLSASPALSPLLLSPPSLARDWARYDNMVTQPGSLPLLPVLSPPPPAARPHVVRPAPRSWSQYATAVVVAGPPSAAAPAAAAAAAAIAGPVAYDSREGYYHLQTLQQLLGVPVAWSAAQTLVFVLRHTRTRNLAVTVAAVRETVQRVNGLAWTGIRHDDMASEADRARVTQWLDQNEALFTNKKSVYSHINPDRRRPSPVRAAGKPNVGKFRKYGKLIFPVASHWWAIHNNPGRDPHQTWAGPGPSRLARMLLAE